MLIGVPKEIKKQEERVGATPSAVASLIHAGHSVIVEKELALALVSQMKNISLLVQQ